MMRQLVLSIFVFVGIAFVFAPFIPQASAYDPFLGGRNHVDCSGNQKSSAVCKEADHSSNPISGPDGLLVNITHIIAYIAGAVAIIMLLIGSITYITSGGDAQKIEEAKNTILYTIVGIVVIILAQALIVYVVNRVS